MGGKDPAPSLAAGGEEPELSALTDHVVICNCNEKVRRVVEDLQLAVAPEPLDAVLVVQEPGLWRAHPDWHPRPSPALAGHFFVLEGCPTDEACLERARIDQARAAIILADPDQGQLADARSTLVALAIERRNPRVHTVMELLSSVNRVHLEATEVNEVVCLGDLSEKLIAQSCVSPGVSRVLGRLLDPAPDGCGICVLSVPDPLVGWPWRKVARRAIERRAPFVVVGLSLAGELRRRVLLNPRAGDPGRDSVLRAADRLIVIAHEPPDLVSLASPSP